MKDYPETHQYGVISIENLSLTVGVLINTPETTMIKGDFGVQIAEDGRVWICINGIAFIRFKPLGKEKKSDKDG